ncbi:MAG: glycosyltransferase [Actinomycetes bacterium]
MTAADLPFVSVVVPVKDDSAALVTCLEALSRQDYPPTRFEVVVADNGSLDDPEPVIGRFVGVRLVREPRPGSYAARNAALSASRGAVLAFTDADCRPTPTWLREAVGALGGRDMIVAGRVAVFARDPHRPHPAEAYELVRAFPQQTYVERSPGFGVTANMITTRAVFDAVGAFDERLHSGGDAEWGRRATSRAVPIAYAPSCVVRHPARPDYRALYGKLRRVTRQHHLQAEAAGRPVGVWTRESARALRPPVGAVRRALTSSSLETPRARAAYVCGEMFVRYASVWLAFRETRRLRRPAGVPSQVLESKK